MKKITPTPIPELYSHYVHSLDEEIPPCKTSKKRNMFQIILVQFNSLSEWTFMYFWFLFRVDMVFWFNFTCIWAKVTMCNVCNMRRDIICSELLLRLEAS